MLALPQWMNGEILEAWGDYVAQRIKDKKPMTERSAVARIKRLQELKDAGHDPLHCLDEAINGHWLDFYVPKDKTIERAHVETWKPEKYERSKEAADKGLQLLKEAKARIRRVA